MNRKFFLEFPTHFCEDAYFEFTIMLSEIEFSPLIQSLCDDLCLENLEEALDTSFFEDPTWKRKPMVEWTSKEVVDFIISELGNLQPRQIEQFQSISGFIFENLSLEYCQFITLPTHLGTSIYQAKEKQIKAQKQLLFDNISYLNTTVTNTQNFTSIDSEQNIKPRRPGRPRSATIIRKAGRRSEKLWEFLIHLLRDSNTCPELIKWENFQEGTFKFVRSEKVAQLWGSRKKNEKMTYEKFSRAMRYYYKSKVLLPVPGKRLVYKFGPCAQGWNWKLPIC